MKNNTRIVFSQYLSTIANLNGIGDASKSFNVQPTVQQKLETRMQESSAFLNQINVVGVEEMSGEKIGLGVGSPIASNTDTSDKDRQTAANKYLNQYNLLEMISLFLEI